MLVNQGINSVSEINYLDKFLAAVVFIAIIESSSQIRGIFPRVGWCGCDGCLVWSGESRREQECGSGIWVWLISSPGADWGHHHHQRSDTTQNSVSANYQDWINIWRQFNVPKIPNGEIVLDLLVSKFNLVWTKFISPSSFPGRG